MKKVGKKKLIQNISVILFIITLVIIICSFIIFKTFFFGAQESPPIKEKALVPLSAQDHILLKFKDSISQEKRADILGKNNLKEKYEIKQIGVKIISIPSDSTPEEIVDRLRMQEKANIEYAEVDVEIKPDFVPNDPYYSSQWFHSKISDPQAWDYTSGAPIIITIPDSGTDCTHTDLKINCLPGWNFYDNNDNSSDVYGHGTATAGTAGAVGNNGIGVAGTAWSAKILPLRVSNLTGWAYFSTIANAIVYAADHGSKVASVSYRAFTSSSVSTAANYMRSKGGLVVMSAGNENTLLNTSNNPSIIVVSATDSNNVRASWSNYGTEIDLAAPGISIYTTNKGGGYGGWSGTSFSSPMTAGIIALIYSVNPNLTADQAQDILFNSAIDIGTTGWDQYYGWGLINATKSVLLARNFSASDNMPPVVSVLSPLNGSTVSGIISISVSASDNVGVLKVELYKDGILSDTDTQSPYSFTWNTSIDSNGIHVISTKAYDSSNNIGSSSINVNVNNIINDMTPPSAPTNLLATAINSSRVQLNWNPSTDNIGVAGYRIYRNSVLIATTSSIVFNDDNILAGTTYSYYVIAYDVAGNPSLQSNLVTVTVPQPPAPQLVITGYAVSQKTASSATITWTSNIPSNGSVLYGKSLLSSSAIDKITGTFHTIILIGLTKQTVYYYQINAQAVDGISFATSSVSTFKTKSR